MGLNAWLSEGLFQILGFTVPDDMVNYVMSIRSEAELEEYMKTLLDFSDNQHKTFFQEIVKRKFPSKANTVPKQQKKKISKNKTPQHEFVYVEVEKEGPAETDADKKKKKTKFVNLYSQEGENAQVVLLKGRHRCECQASKHELINNCIECGRVVCQQEGSGPCLFCGTVVMTIEEERQMESNSKGAAKLMSSLQQQGRPKGWEAAIALRDKLLECDKSTEANRVIDDDNDYFQVNSQWLSADERQQLEDYKQKLHDQKHASRLDKKMTFDFAGRQIVEDKTSHAIDLDRIHVITSAGTSTGASRSTEVDPIRHVAPGIMTPVIKLDKLKKSATADEEQTDKAHTWRVQDQGLQEMSDSGKCLSMHQPWASLLVEGIKIHEGRSWYTEHRGRLWIAATARAPDPGLVRAVEDEYRAKYPGKELPFPSYYPSGCLLGCVTVDKCLPQEEYQQLYPGGESDSPYVFICSNPISLPLRFPVKGQHKIYTLDKTIQTAAMKQCMKSLQ